MNHDSLNDPLQAQTDFSASAPASSEQYVPQSEIVMPQYYQEPLPTDPYAQPYAPPAGLGMSATPPDPISSYSGTHPNYYSPQPYAQPYLSQYPVAPRKKHTLRNMIVIVVVLVLLLSGASIYFMVQIIHTPTSIQQTPINVQSAATGTPSGSDAYPSYLPGQGTIVMDDPLQTADNWNNTIGGRCLFEDGAFHVNSLTNNTEWNCFAQSSDPTVSHATNSAFEVQMTIIKGDCGGVDLRISPSAYAQHHKFYYVSICQDGNYAIFKYNVASLGLAVVKNYAYSPAIKQGLNQVNVVDVVARGSTIDIFDNRQSVARVQDSSLTQGTFGLAVSTGRKNITEAVYRNAKIWAVN